MAFNYKYIQLTAIVWEKGDVHKAIKRRKLQKSADKRGFVPELLKYALNFFIAQFVHNFNDLITTGDVPPE